MLPEYLDQIYEDELYAEPVEQTMDIQLSSVMNILMIGVWVCICLIGLAVIFWGKSTLFGIYIIGISTFLGMVIKPTFGLCLMMMALPTAAGVGIWYMFSLERGVGILLAISFLLNLLLSRPRLQIRNKAMWIHIGFVMWVTISVLWATYFRLEVVRVFTQVQLLTLALIIYWIITINGIKTFYWSLRSYILGTLGSVVLTLITGTAMAATTTGGREVAEGRYMATVGAFTDPNMLAAIMGLAVFSAVYLLFQDKSKFWRGLYLVAILLLPLMILRTGSRGALIAFIFTITSPLLFARQTLRRPALIAILLLVTLIASVVTAFLVEAGGLTMGVLSRLTDVEYAKQGLAFRMLLVKEGISSIAKYPLGMSFYGWRAMGATGLVVHNDFFMVLVAYGIPGAALFALYIVMVTATVHRILLGPTKIFTRAVLIFLLVNGLSLLQMYDKFFWVFLVLVLVAQELDQRNRSQTAMLAEKFGNVDYYSNYILE
ncbi:MAG: O-antigen ligase family protein [Planctomycetota bacterium]|nr:MAG: O-antigen ligase family protein [Planctomycetota bacterium]